MNISLCTKSPIGALFLVLVFGKKFTHNNIKQKEKREEERELVFGKKFTHNNIKQKEKKEEGTTKSDTAKLIHLIDKV
ncbi:hypothetical protein [Turicibacter sanguinis]|uniref:hypothetical protein n=1 Tax=Turicibacter sanguinis TaxID=154288 RepID=UPI0018A1038A|nr:hypothetical protein [Turicibacter sanguinis]